MISMQRICCGARRKSMWVLTLLLVSAPIALAQKASASKDRDQGYWVFSGAVGTSLPTGATSATTNEGVVLGYGFGRHGPGRWFYPFNFMLSLGNLPTAILQQVQEPDGQTNLLTFTFDPAFDLVRGQRWGIYATAGGGFSLKQVVLLQPDPSCNGDYGNGCYNTVSSESSNQPALDAGLEFTFRPRPNGIIEWFQETRYVDMFTPKGQYAGFGTAGERLVVLTMGIRVNFAHGPNPSTAPY